MFSPGVSSTVNRRKLEYGVRMIRAGIRGIPYTLPQGHEDFLASTIAAAREVRFKLLYGCLH